MVGGCPVDGTITDTTIIWGGNAEGDDPNRDTEVSNDGATGTTRAGVNGR